MARNSSNGPICRFLSTLNPTSTLEYIVVQGEQQDVSSFVQFNEDTNLASFLTPGGDIIVADCSLIDAINYTTA
ncbi:hypothetical protein MTP04_25900 [Lysinibacillus sp. PLM2]|nr:hypothetical protein MTP04_25900 [Lysinibacillus sp. PLM2]